MKKFYLIVNPQGGRKNGPGLLEEIRPLLENAGLELKIIETEFGGHALELAHQIDLDGFDGIVVIGGDGTMHEVVNGMLTRQDKKKLPIGLIPGGSGNSLMVDLGLVNPLDAANAIVLGHTRKIDVAEMKVDNATTFAFNIIGWGLATDVGILAEKWRWLGPARYSIVSLLKVLRGTTARSAKLLLDDKEIVDEFTLVMACNTRYTGNMKIAPNAKLDDGLLDVVVVRHGASRLKLLSLLNRIYEGTHIENPLVEYYTASQFSLVPDQDDILNIDGELSGSTPIEVKMRQGAFEMFDPSAT